MESDGDYKTYSVSMNNQEAFWNTNLNGVAKKDGWQFPQKICKIPESATSVTSWKALINACNIPTVEEYNRDGTPNTGASAYTGRYVNELGYSASNAKSIMLPGNAGISAFTGKEFKGDYRTYWGNKYAGGENRCFNIDNNVGSLNIKYREIDNPNYDDFMSCMRHEVSSVCREGGSQACSSSIYNATDACSAKNRAATE